MTEGTVMKIGGSLMDSAEKILAEIPASPTLIVPGGGIFADFVRIERIDDEAAHWKAIEAMEKYGRFLSTYGYPVTHELKIPGEPTILLPKSVLQKEDPLPHTWDITSDSIAAWVAGVLKCRLVIVKSTDFGEDLVDPSFSSVLAQSGMPAVIINGRAFGSVRGYFEATRL